MDRQRASLIYSDSLQFWLKSQDLLLAKETTVTELWWEHFLIAFCIIKSERLFRGLDISQIGAIWE